MSTEATKVKQNAADERPKTLAGKLAAIMNEISRVPKRGYNQHFKYNYVMESDMSDVIRPLLARFGVGLTFSVDEVTVLENNISQVKVTYTVHDADTGESIPMTCFGWGQDKNDKGIYKAITGAAKYWMFKSFLVSTGDDPENDENHGQGQGNGQQQPGNRQAQKSGQPTEEDLLRADYDRYEADAIKMRDLKTQKELDDFMKANMPQIDKNRYAQYYFDLANMLAAELIKAA